LRVALVTAVPVVIPALVKNEFCGVVTLVNVGVMPVTTLVEPGVPLTSPTTPVKVGVTLVTHVAPDAGDTSAVLRLPTVSAARSAWFEADANSANRTAVRRGTMVRFGLVIPRPPESALVLIIAQTVWQIRVKRIDCRAFGRLVVAVVKPQHHILPMCTQASTSAPWPRHGARRSSFHLKQRSPGIFHEPDGTDSADEREGAQSCHGAARGMARTKETRAPT